jgi:hypothetical protein
MDLTSMPKGLGKKKEDFFRAVTQRNRNGSYRNKNTLKANHKVLKGYIKGFEGASDKRGTLDTKKAWATGFISSFEEKHPIEKEYWEHEYPNSDDKYVLEIAPLPEGLDLEKMKYMIQDYLSHRLEFYKEAKRSLFVEDEFSEWFIEKVTGGKQIGKGHTAMDVKTLLGDGIDVFCIIMNKAESNEKSLIQNFKKTGKDLDILFNEQRFEEAIQMFMTNYRDKLNEVIKAKSMRNLYYLGFVSTVDEVFLVNFKINIENIENTGVKKATKGGVSIFLKNFIKPEHGTVKLYKSKKRVELRLKRSVVEHEHAVSIYKLASPISNGEGDVSSEEEEV